jgi:hypothetical protein
MHQHVKEGVIRRRDGTPNAGLSWVLSFSVEEVLCLLEQFVMQQRQLPPRKFNVRPVTKIALQQGSVQSVGDIGDLGNRFL